MASGHSVVFAEPVRTAIGTFGGSLKDVPAANIGAVAIVAAVARAGLRPDELDTVVMGNVVQAGSKMNPARQATVHAGLPVTVPALTVNRVCGSGVRPSSPRRTRLRWAMQRSRWPAEWRTRICALPRCARSLGLSLGRWPALRQCLARWVKRRVLGRSLGLAHRRSRGKVSGHARGAGPVGLPIATAFRKRASRRAFQNANRADRIAW